MFKLLKKNETNVKKNTNLNQYSKPRKNTVNKKNFMPAMRTCPDFHQTKLQTQALQAQTKDDRKYQTFYGQTIQMKNVNDLKVEDFSDYFFDESKYKDCAYKQWVSEGSIPNLPKTENDRIYFEAQRKEQERQIKEALASTDKSTHPETQRFLAELKNLQFTDNEADEIWSQLLLGIDKQKSQNDVARLNTNTPELKAIYGTTEDYLFTSDLDVIRNQNEYYEKVAELVKGKMVVEKGKKLALWSGGYDLSSYASRRGYVTLEESKFGKVLDSFYLCDKWNLIGPLWNIISKTFVSQYIENGGTEFHVFIRAYDPASVLIRQEIAEIYNLDPSMKFTIKWHCIVKQGDTYHEIAEDGTVAPTPDEDKSAYDEGNCLQRLLRYYESGNHQSERGYQTMQKGFKTVLASNFDQVREHLAVADFRMKVHQEAEAIWHRKGAPQGQSEQSAKEDYINAEAAVIERMRQEWCKAKSYEIWKGKGAPENQPQDKMDADYAQAENEFQQSVRDRIRNITLKRMQSKQSRILTKARSLWIQKGRLQQSQEQQNQDYYEAERLVNEEDIAYEQKIPYYAKLEILMNIS